jgi:hypothetical protein
MATYPETRRELAVGPKPQEVPIRSSTRLAEELANIPDEPFLSVEARLVGWSLGVGAILLVFLVWVSYTFFAG